MINEHVNRVTLPLAQKIVLVAILIVYPAVSTILNYINPPTDHAVESRILQIYLPAMILQLTILFGILFIALRAPIKSQNTEPPSTGQVFAGLGLRLKDITLKNIFIALIFLFTAILILNLISSIVDYYGLFGTEDITYLLPRTAVEKAFWITLSLLAGFAEELCFRGFVISRLKILTGRLWPGVVFGSLCFGLGHLYQGFSGVLLIGVYGFLFSLLYIARGSLIPCIIAHALQDILAAFAAGTPDGGI